MEWCDPTCAFECHPGRSVYEEGAKKYHVAIQSGAENSWTHALAIEMELWEQVWSIKEIENLGLSD